MKEETMADLMLFSLIVVIPCGVIMMFNLVIGFILAMIFAVGPIYIVLIGMMFEMKNS